MKFVDLGRQYTELKLEIDRRIKSVVDHDQYVNGPEVQLLENKLADRVGTKFCISTASGSDALLLALMAAGIEEADEVMITPFTYITTKEMICFLKATPVFVDINEKTFVMEASNLSDYITADTRAILSVNLFGQCPDFDQINDFTANNGLVVIEDPAQRLGSELNGEKSGSLDHLGCANFFPSKPLGCYGDDGAIFTDDNDLAKIIIELKEHGQSSPYRHERVGLNSRLDNIQAAVLLAKIETFDQELKQRQVHAALYNSLLRDLKGELTTPSVSEKLKSAWAKYAIRVRNRDQIANFLNNKDIPVAVYYREPIYSQPAYRRFGHNGLTPRTEEACKEVLSLPFYPDMPLADRERVSDALHETLRTVPLRKNFVALHS